MRWGPRVVGLLGAALVIAGVVALSLSPVLLAQDKAKDKAKDKATKDKVKDKTTKDKGKAVPLIVRQREIRKALAEARKSREALLAASLGTMRRPVFGGHDKKALKTLDETIVELMAADKAVTALVDKYRVPTLVERLRGVRRATGELRTVRRQLVILKPGYYGGYRAKGIKNVDKGIAELAKADKFLVGKLTEGKDKAKDKGPKDKAPKDKAPKDKAPKDKVAKDKVKLPPKDKPAPKEPKPDTNPATGLRKALLGLRQCKTELEGITHLKKELFGGFRATALAAIDAAIKDLVEAEKVAVKRVEEGD